jgi:tRNA pseudouridine38-40 synthase
VARPGRTERQGEIVTTSATPRLPRVRLDLAYVGAGFSGWQMQPDRRTVQGELADRLERLLGRDCRPVGAGRTDTGVHARGQVAHVVLQGAAEVLRVCRALPKLCQDDIQILAARAVSPAFDARRSATSRRYAYRLCLMRNLFDPFAFHVPWRLDRDAMNAACARVRGVHDFTSFCKAGSLKTDNHCHMDLCALEWDDNVGILHIRADRFLHHMVRNLVGVLVEVGRGRRQPADLDRILEARDRRQAGMTAPAHGLFLEEVTYPPALLDPGYLPPDPAPVDPARPAAAAEGDEA